jgi:hypothetical protein
MQGKICGLLTLVAVAGLALPVAGQVERNRSVTLSMGNSAHTAQLPYTAEYKITHVKTLADGSTITQESTEVVALDSQGRRMTSTTVSQSADKAPATHVGVHDPVARNNSSWTVPGNKATVTAMPEPGAAHTSCAASTPRTATPATPAAPRVQHERPSTDDLGTETIQGIEARGYRTITTTPAGAVGNNEPLVRTSEIWTAIAPGLRGFVARNASDDPQSGKTTRELTSFNQAEPDAAVFQPPSDYEIVNKDAPGSTCPSSESAEKPMAPIDPPPTPEQ